MSRMSPAEFAGKWEKESKTATERDSAQPHWMDLCEVFDHPKPGSSPDYKFERTVLKVGTKDKGFADVFKRGHFIVEYKAPGRDLGAALKQATLYARDLDNPPLLITSDLRLIEVNTAFTGTSPKTYRVTLDDIREDHAIAGTHLRAQGVLRAALHQPAELDPRLFREKITLEATQRVGQVARRLGVREGKGRSAHLMMRLVFAFFAENVGMLPRGLVGRVLERAQAHPERSESYFRELFSAMQGGGEFWGTDIRHFNGGLFDSSDALAITAQDAADLRFAAELDWSEVEPSIFGTLFENSLDADTRSRRGAHYTSVTDIERIVDRVVMEPLWTDWDALRHDLVKMKRNQRLERIFEFQDRLTAVKVLDPACGSGNFLFVALKKMLDLEHQVRAAAVMNDIGEFEMPPLVHPRQMLGIEIEPFAHELTSITLWMGYFQWKRAHGGHWETPILQKLDNVQNRDALLNEDGSEAEWPAADFIVGNPPFLGDKVMRGHLGDDYTDRLRTVYGQRLPGQSDLVCYWPEKARAAIEAGNTRRAGFVTTNSIRGGKNRVVLERIKASGDLFMAWPDEPWEQDGAAVRVSLFGFDGGSEELRTLNDQHVAVINADLTVGSDVTAAVPLTENAGLSFIGTQKGGAFDIPEEVALAWLDLPNSTGVSNHDVVKPWVNGMDITRRPSRRWIVDFNQMSESVASAYLLPFTYIQQTVKPERDRSRDRLSKVHWWLHQRSRPDMRVGLAGLSRYLVTPRVAKHRLWVYVPMDTVPDSRLVVIAREDGLTHGVLSSSIHEWWSLAQGGWHGVGNDPQYNAVSCFETFPFPHPTEEQRTEIEESVQYIVQLRECLLGLSEKATLTGLYNDVVRLRHTLDATHPAAALALAHDRLDTAVATAYGWESLPAKEEVLARLLALNLERAATQ